MNDFGDRTGCGHRDRRERWSRRGRLPAPRRAGERRRRSPTAATRTAARDGRGRRRVPRAGERRWCRSTCSTPPRPRRSSTGSPSSSAACTRWCTRRARSCARCTSSRVEPAAFREHLEQEVMAFYDVVQPALPHLRAGARQHRRRHQRRWSPSSGARRALGGTEGHHRGAGARAGGGGRALRRAGQLRRPGHAHRRHGRPPARVG